MLLNTSGKGVHPAKRGSNHIEEGFVVSHKSDLKFLRPLREVKAVLAPKCGRMFQLGARAKVVL